MKKFLFITTVSILTFVLAFLSVMPFLGEAQISTGPLDKGLVGHWALDNITGAQDKTPYSNNGTGAGGITIGGATDQHGQANRATTFDGTDDYVEKTDTPSLSVTGALTLSAWVKYNTIGSNPTLIIKAESAGTRSYGLHVKSDGKVLFYASQNGIDQVGTSGLSSGFNGGGSQTVVTGAWFHIVGTFTPNVGAYSYVNGVLDNSDISGPVSSIIDSAASMKIGDGTNGSIADVRIYNRALSQAEVTSLYSSYRPKQAISSLQKGLVGQWKLDQASNKSTTVTADATPYGNNGTGAGSITLGGATDQHGQANRATTFGATDKYINIPDTSLFSYGDGSVDSPFSVSCWFKANSVSSYQGMISKWDNNASAREWRIYFSSDGKLNMELWDQSLGGYRGRKTDPLSSSTWYHLVITYDATELSSGVKIYLNGTQSDTANQQGGSYTSMENGTSPLFIGQYQDFGPTVSEFNGILADVRIYNRALSATEVTSLYNSYRPVRQISSLYKGLIIDLPLAQQDLIGTTAIANKTPFSQYNGTLGGGITVGGQNDRHGQANKATNFDGSDDNINLGDVTQLNSVSAFTVAFWMNQDVLDITDVIFDKKADTNNELLFTTRSDGLFYFEIDSGGIKRAYFDYSTVISAGVWAHVVVVFDGTQSTNATRLKVYVNNSQQTLGFTLTIPATTANLAGYNAYIGYTSSAFDGKLSNFKLWNRVLSAGEITSLYNQYK